MTRRASLLFAISCLVVALVAAAAWRQPGAPPATAPAGPSPVQAAALAPLAVAPAEADPAPPTADDDALPVPPLPPRIAEGEDYEKCLAMLTDDPEGANSFADAWEATGGGDGAQHCHGLAQIALGNPAAGADMLNKLASDSNGPAAGRAAVFGQASQAFLMAGDAERAYAAATLALTLSPDDPDLLIGRSAASATLEHYRDVIEDLDHALARDPKRADALVYRAAAWRQLGDLARAADDIDRATALDPDAPDALLERGIIRQRSGDLRGARRDWERAVALAPDTPTGDLAQQNLDLLAAGPEQ